MRLRYQYGGGGGVAVGQQNDPPVSLEYHTAEWTFAPAKENGLTIGFLAWLSDVQPVGNNIRVIWFQQDGPTAWSSWGWTDIDKLEGARWVRDFIGDQQLFLDDQQLVNEANLYLADQVFIQMAAADPSLLPTPVVDPQLMVQGCLTGDPTGQNILNNGGDVNMQAAGFVQTGCAMAHILSGWDLQPSIDPNHPENSALVDVLIGLAADSNQNVENIGNGLGTIKPCTCSVAYGSVKTVPGSRWKKVAEHPHHRLGTKTCIYERPATAIKYQAGLTHWICLSCYVKPHKVTGVRTGEATVGEHDDCPINPTKNWRI